MWNRRSATLTGLIILGLAFRLAICLSFSTSSPDGDQYYAISQSLLRDHRYAFRPAPAPLTHSRLPGYPILTALLDTKPQPREAHVERAAIANALFDMTTALLLALLLSSVEAGAGAYVAVVATVFCPLLILQSVAALTESFATLLGVLELYLLFRAAKGRPLFVVLAGVVAGAAQLVRFDAIILLPVAAWVIVGIGRTNRERLRLLAMFALAALLTFSPWPIRNEVRFGHAYPQGTEWLKQNGDPLPTGIIKWMGTWNSSRPGESYLSDLIVFGRPFSGKTPGVLLPQMYDSKEEQARVSRLIDKIGSTGAIDPASDEAFIALANERTKNKPLRTYLILPLKRLPYLLLPPERQTIHWVRIPLLHWPASYALFPWFYVLSWSFAVLGLVLLFLDGKRWFALLMLAPIVLRIVVYSFAVPHQVSSRYFTEAFPFIIALASYAVARLGPIIKRTHRR